MNLIVGLGNPGDKYCGTRHNVGFMVLDKLVDFLNLESSSKEDSAKFKSAIQIIGNTTLAWPNTFMNKVGEAVFAIINYYKISVNDLYVVHDDLDIRLGQYKIQFGVGPKVHGGILSIEHELGTKDFNRIRVGIDNRKLEDRMPGEQYVLEKFSSAELEVLDRTIDKVVKDLAVCLNLPILES
ncbi:MAG: aminoacyl-tRNA hydrolase [Patescibacteria group bacterium]|nr:aminoacyl-tRNA hydrolase [Patescibacteria group bacterium]